MSTMVDVSAPYSFINPRPQVLALPPSLQAHILENVTPKVHSKLIQTCKLFFHLKPLTPISKAITYNSSFLTATFGNSYKRLNLNDLTSSLWLYEEFGIALIGSKIVEIIFSKVHSFVLKDLNLFLITGVTYADYLRLTETKTIEIFIYTKTKIKYSDDSVVPYEVLLKEIPNAVEFKGVLIKSSKDSEETLSTLPKFLKLKKFAVVSIDDHSDIVDVSNFIRDHRNVEFSFKLIKNQPFKEAIEQASQSIGAVVEF